MEEEGDISELFQSIINSEIDMEIPYAKLGETMLIEFSGKRPDQYELKDYIINEDGALKYINQTGHETAIEFDNKTGTFILENNLSAYYSSDSADYEPGATIRGFRLVCSWEDQKYEYVFVVSTDAM